MIKEQKATRALTRRHLQTIKLKGVHEIDTRSVLQRHGRYLHPTVIAEPPMNPNRLFSKSETTIMRPPSVIALMCCRCTNGYSKS